MTNCHAPSPGQRLVHLVCDTLAAALWGVVIWYAAQLVAAKPQTYEPTPRPDRITFARTLCPSP